MYLHWKSKKYSIKTQGFWILISSFPPIVVGVLYLVRAAPALIDIMPFSFIPVILSFFIIIFKYNFMGVNDYIINYALMQIKEGMLVIDEHGRIAEFNTFAASTFDWLTVGNKGKRILEYKEGMAIVENEADFFEIELKRQNESKVYEFRVSHLMERGQRAGQVLVFRDVTEQKMAIERLNYMATDERLCDSYYRNKLFEENDS